MATANKFLEQPSRGSLVGVWDTPVNENMGKIDNSLGGTATIALTNAPVILSSAQYQCVFITFTGALSGNCAITFPTVGSFYTVQNLTSNTSAFQVTLQTTAAGSQAVGCPWGAATDIMSDASGNMKYRNMQQVGDFKDFAGSSVPAWISNCTVAPYLNCDGTAFSSATYPVLATVLGGITLPDARGRFRATLNQGQSRITSGSSTGGVDGNTNLSVGGSQTTTLSSQNVPNALVTDTHTHFTVAGSTGLVQLDNTHAIGLSANFASINNYSLVNGSTATPTFGVTSTAPGSNILVGSTSPTNFSNLPPAYIGGITLIRAA